MSWDGCSPVVIVDDSADDKAPLRKLPGAANANAFCANPSLNGLLEDAWLAHGARPVRAQVLLDLAVVQATGLEDPMAGFMVHLSRALLGDGRTPEARSADLAVATSMLRSVTNPRARRLVDLADAVILAATAASVAATPCAQEQNLARFLALPLASDAGIDDADDFFVLQGRAQAAIRLGRPHDVMGPLYAALMLAGRSGYHGRRWAATVALAEQLLLSEQAAEALDLLEPLVREFCSLDAEDQPRAAVHQLIARARIACGHVEEAITDLLMHAQTPPWSSQEPLACSLHESLATAYVALGRHVEANRHIAQAAALARELGDELTMGACHLHAARLAAVRQQPRAAIKSVQQALGHLSRSTRPIDVLILQLDAERLQGDEHANAGDFDLALEAGQRHAALSVRRDQHVQQARLDTIRARHAALAGLNLTLRELDCLRLCASGKTAGEIGAALGISEWTAVYHLDRIKKRFGLTRRQHMVARALSLGLIGD